MPVSSVNHKLELRIGDPLLQSLDKGLTLILILAIGPGLRDRETGIAVMEPSHQLGVVNLKAQFVEQKAVELLADPVGDLGLFGMLQQLQQLAGLLGLDLGRCPAARGINQAVNPRAMKRPT